MRTKPSLPLAVIAAVAAGWIAGSFLPLPFDRGAPDVLSSAPSAAPVPVPLAPLPDPYLASGPRRPPEHGLHLRGGGPPGRSRILGNGRAGRPAGGAPRSTPKPAPIP